MEGVVLVYIWMYVFTCVFLYMSVRACVHMFARVCMLVRMCIYQLKIGKVAGVDGLHQRGQVQ